MESVRRFLDRHRRMFSFVGAMIVFFTFVINEGQRDKLRSLVASVDKAYDEYRRKTDLQSVKSELREVTEQLSKNLVELSGPKDPHQHDLAVANNELYQLYLLLRVQRSELDNLDLLIDRVPDEAWPFKYVDKRAVMMQQRIAAQGVSVMEGALSQAHDRAYLKNALDGLKTMRDSATRIQPYLKDVEQSTERRLVVYHQTVSEKYQFYTWLSYGLYVIGWGLGLMGKLVGAGE